MSLTLSELGERRILREIIPDFVSSAGDDCAAIPISKGNVIVTTDPVPPPAAETIGKDSDPYWMGRLLVTINASDLAAAGADPRCFLAAIECPGSTTVDKFRRLLQGIADACEAEQLPYVGGNLREAQRLAATGFAVGSCGTREPIRRVGAQPGDIIASVGLGGHFWRDACRLRRGDIINDKKTSYIFAPHSQLCTMRELAATGRIHAAMDNSDGLLPTVAELAFKSNVKIVLDLEKLTVADSDGEELSPARMWLGWGDWNVLVAVSSSNIGVLQTLAAQSGSEVVMIGEVLAGPHCVRVRREHKEIEPPRIESERFAPDSWFEGGIESYFKILKEAHLP